MANTISVKTSSSENPQIPRSIPFIIGNEFSERFSFYGMRSILAIFLVQQFFNPHGLANLTNEAEAKSNAYTHAFSTLVYFTPVLGGILADWFFGKYRVILIGSIIYTFGHFILSIFDQSLAGFISGMMVIAFAAGAIKSCVSANVGDQFDHSNQHLMSSIYGWFYFSINAGSTVSILLIPVLYKNCGAAVAFGVPGILMAIATVIFYGGNKKYVKVPPTGIKKDNFISINFFVLSTFLTKKDKSKTAWDIAETKYGSEKVDAMKAVWRVMSVFAFIPIFWGMWDMNQSEWALQADKLDLNLGFGIKMLASQVQAANAIFLLLMIPVFNYGVYPLVEKIGFKLNPLRKIGAGLFVTALSFVIIALLQRQVELGLHPSVWWQILAYLLLSAAEVMVSITGLEYAYTQSPPSMKSTMTAIWYLTYSVGTFFTTIINVGRSKGGMFYAFADNEKYFWLFVGIMLFFFILFLFVSPRIKEKAYLVEHHIGDGLEIKDDKTQEIHPDNPIV